MKSIIALLLLVGCSIEALADISPVRVVERKADVEGCKFVGQVMKSNGLFQTKTANRILQEALAEAAEAGADTAIVLKSGHSGVSVDAYACGTSAK